MLASVFIVLGRETGCEGIHTIAHGGISVCGQGL
jgi:hypothetical protein